MVSLEGLPQAFWKSVFWTDETKLEPNRTSQHTRFKPLGLFAATGTWASSSHRLNHELICIPMYSRVKALAVCLIAKDCINWIMKQDNDHSSTSTAEWLKRKWIEVLQWPKVETSTWLKYCGGTLRELCVNKCLPNLNELKHHHNGEWAKDSPHIENKYF